MQYIYTSITNKANGKLCNWNRLTDRCVCVYINIYISGGTTDDIGWLLITHSDEMSNLMWLNLVIIQWFDRMQKRMLCAHQLNHNVRMRVCLCVHQMHLVTLWYLTVLRSNFLCLVIILRSLCCFFFLNINSHFVFG